MSFSGGGGIALGTNSSTGNIEQSLIANNSTQGDGGGILCLGQQIHLNVTIDGNSARRGGGFFHEGRETRFSHMTLVGNSATEVGGGIWMSPANSVFHGNIIATNTAPSAPDVGLSRGEQRAAVTPLLPIGSQLRLDFFLPPNQPDIYWFGAVQAYASCPSVAMNNEYLGQVELTGRPVNAFSTLTFSVPANVRAVLSQNRPDCFLSIAVNTNATPVSPVLDNLRFAP